MTRRSVILGLLGAALLAGVTFFNDMVLKGTFLIGNFIPISVFGSLILFVLLVNPLLGRLSRKAALTGRELAAMAAIVLFACYLPGRGLLHYFTNFMMMPQHHERTTPGWRSEPPDLVYNQVLDWDKMVARLGEAGGRPSADPLRRVWDRLPPDWQARFEAGAVSAADGAVRDTLLVFLNAAIADPAFHEGLPVPPGVPVYVRILDRQDGSGYSAEEHAFFSRGLLEFAMPDVLKARRAGVLENVPPQMLTDTGEDPAAVLDGFVAGLAQGDESISLRDIPWHAWRRTLLFWVPLILTMCVTVTGLALVLHRQWSSHEHLPYPTIEFAMAVLPEENSFISQVFRHRLFWIGAGVVFLIHMTNYLYVWFPDVVIPVKTSLDFTPLLELFPVFRTGGGWGLFRPTLYFTAIGFAFYLSSDVALALGVAPFLYTLAVGIAAGYGLAFGGGHLRASIDSFLYLGASVGLFMTVIHSGRHYYRTTFGRSLGLRRGSGDQVEPYAVWGARVFLAGLLGFVLQLVTVGVDWQIALLYTFGAVIIFTTLSRLLAEAGAFFVAAYCFPCAMLWGFMGAKALGHGQLLVLAMVSSLLLIDPRESFMPFAMSALQLGDRMKLKVGRVATWGLVALIVGMVVGVPASLYWQYQRGATQAGDWWAVQSVPRFAFNNSVQIARTLEAQGSMQISDALSGWERFLHIVPQPSLLIAFGVTFSLVLGFTFLRHRFAWWPLHPVVFVLLGTWQSRQLAFSFLVGWMIKKAVSKYGGTAAYRKLKPLMIGLIAGEILAGVMPLIVGAIYYHITGEPPKPFRVLPG